MRDNYCKYNDEPESGLQTNAKHFVFLLLVVLSVFGNIFIIILAVKYTARKNLHHLIINMAVSDTIFAIFSMFNYIYVENIVTISKGLSGVVLGGFSCKFVPYVCNVSITVSFVTLLVISIERFRATRQTLRRSRPYTLKQRMAVLSSCWFIPMLLFTHIPVLAYFNERHQLCRYYDIRISIAILVTSSLLRIPVIITIISLSILTIKRLSRRQVIQAHLDEVQRNLRTRRRRAAVTMVLASLLLYVCCWLPRLS